MNVCARILQFTQVPTILGLALLLPSCSPIPREYIHQSERGVTLSALVSEPNRYQGKIVILGGVIVEEKEEGDQVFLRLKNRPLDKDYVPHRPPSLDGSEAGYYWLTLSRHDLPESEPRMGSCHRRGAGRGNTIPRRTVIERPLSSWVGRSGDRNQEMEVSLDGPGERCRFKKKPLLAGQSHFLNVVVKRPEKKEANSRHPSDVSPYTT